MSQEIVNNQEELLDEETQDDTDLEIDLEDEEEVESVEDGIDWESRAKKAEALLIQRKKQSKMQAKPTQSVDNTLTEESVEIKILKAQGVTEDQIVQLKKIARVNETGLIESQSDPYFVAWKNTREQEAKANKAKLPASRGSSSISKAKDFNSQGLSEAEHKELWKQRQGN